MRRGDCKFYRYGDYIDDRRCHYLDKEAAYRLMVEIYRGNGAITRHENNEILKNGKQTQIIISSGKRVNSNNIHLTNLIKFLTTRKANDHTANNKNNRQS